MILLQPQSEPARMICFAPISGASRERSQTLYPLCHSFPARCKSFRPICRIRDNAELFEAIQRSPKLLFLKTVLFVIFGGPADEEFTPGLNFFIAAAFVSLS